MARAREKGQENPGDLSRYRAAYVVHIRMPCLDPLPLSFFSLSSSRSFLRRAFVCSTSLPFGVSGDCSGLHLSFIRFKPPSPSCTLLPCVLSFIDRVPLPFFRRIPFLETLQPLRQLEIFFPPSQRKKELLHPSFCILASKLCVLQLSPRLPSWQALCWPKKFLPGVMICGNGLRLSKMSLSRRRS